MVRLERRWHHLINVNLSKKTNNITDSSTISEEMLENFTLLNEEEKTAVLELAKTFIKRRNNDFKNQSLEE